MNKDFEREYAKIVTDFVQKMPSDYTITYEAIDSYFRRCILYITTGNAEVAVPDFFRQMVAADAASGTHCCCDFIRAQREVLMLYASLEETFSFEKSRRLAFLNDRLMVMCEQAGVKETVTLKGGETNISQDTVKSLNRLLEESASIVFKNQRSTTPKYVRHTEVERETEAESLLDVAREIEQRIDREIEARHPIKEPEQQKEDSAPVFVNMNIDDLLHGKGPDWAKDLLKDKKGTVEGEGLEGDTKPTLSEAFAKLNGMIGLNSVKRQVKSLADTILVNGWRKEENLKNQPMSLHLVFSGNPGTGKTTVARIIAEIYAALGVLSTGQMVEVDRSKLVGPYLGQTEERTQEVIESALGGVLFIDEAYSLAPEGKADEYGHAAIDTILKAMEDHYDNLVVIAAGYDEPMKSFIESNPGLKSRFPMKIHFEDYDGDQLYEIFQTMVQSGDYRLDESAIVAAQMHFYQMYKNRGKDFGNGREVRNCFDEIRRKQAERLIELYGGMKPPKEELKLLTQADIMAASK